MKFNVCNQISVKANMVVGTCLWSQNMGGRERKIKYSRSFLTTVSWRQTGSSSLKKKSLKSNYTEFFARNSKT